MLESGDNLLAASLYKALFLERKIGPVGALGHLCFDFLHSHFLVCPDLVLTVSETQMHLIEPWSYPRLVLGRQLYEHCSLSPEKPSQLVSISSSAV